MVPFHIPYSHTDLVALSSSTSYIFHIPYSPYSIKIKVLYFAIPMGIEFCELEKKWTRARSRKSGTRAREKIREQSLKVEIQDSGTYLAHLPTESRCATSARTFFVRPKLPVLWPSGPRISERPSGPKMASNGEDGAELLTSIDASTHIFGFLWLAGDEYGPGSLPLLS